MNLVKINNELNKYKFGILLAYFLTCYFYFALYLQFLEIFDIMMISLAFTLCMTYIFYLNKVTDAKEDAINTKDIVVKGVSSQKLISVSVGLLIPGLFILLFYKKVFLLTYILCFVFGSIYSIKIKLGNLRFRLKEIFLFKNLYVILIGTATIFLPLYYFFPTDILLFSWLFFYIIILILDIFWDVKDIKGDRKCGIRTIPSLLGLTGSKILLVTVPIIFFSGFIFFFRIWLIPLLLMSIYFLFIGQNRSYLYYHGVYYMFSLYLLFLIFVT